MPTKHQDVSIGMRFEKQIDYMDYYTIKHKRGASKRRGVVLNDNGIEDAHVT